MYKIEIDSHYSYLTNILLYATNNGIESDIKLNGATLYNIGTSEMEMSIDINNNNNNNNNIDNDNESISFLYGSRIAIGLGMPKSGTEYWYFTSQTILSNILMIPNWKLVFGKNKRSNVQETNYWNKCAVNNILTTFSNKNRLIEKIINRFVHNSKYNSQFADGDMAHGCGIDNYIKSTWQSDACLFFCRQELELELNNEIINTSDNNSNSILKKYINIFYEKSSTYMANPVASMSLTFYARYINNLSINKKYYPTGVLKYFLLLRNPIDRCYSEIFWKCQRCNGDNVEKYLLNEMDYFVNNHRYYKKMYQYINANANAKEYEYEYDTSMDNMIFANYINGYLYDIVSNSIYNYFSKEDVYDGRHRRPRHGHESYQFIKKHLRQHLDMSLQTSCYFPIVKMWIHFYDNFDRITNKHSGKNTNTNTNDNRESNRIKIALKISQIDNRTNQEKSQLMTKFLHWITDGTNNNNKESMDKLNKKLNAINLQNITMKHSSHSNADRKFIPKPISEKLHNKLQTFFQGCNKKLYHLLQNNPHLLLEPFIPWDVHDK